MILSVSRRTDIPAFYAKWFANRVKEGSVMVKNPFNANQISRVPITPDIVDCIVFWTKNPKPITEYLPEIAKAYNNAFYFQYTINAYDRDIEPGLPDLNDRLHTFADLSEKYGNIRMVWRYDPIFISHKYTLEWHIESFYHLFNRLKNYTDTCVVSFIDMYAKTAKNIKGLEISVPDESQIIQFAEAVSKSMPESGMMIRTCAEAVDLNKYGFMPNSCIDKVRIEKIIGCSIKAKADGQRENCQCIECADIGEYNSCGHGCKYCYATYNASRVEAAMAAHDDDSPLLIGSVGNECKVTEYAKAKSLKTGGCGMQLSFI